MTFGIETCHARGMSKRQATASSRWFPFNSNEIQIVLAVYAFLAGLLVYGGFPPGLLLWGSPAFLVLAYLAGLLVHAQRAAHDLRFVPDGGLAGAGYHEHFRLADSSLLLMHVDDDWPSRELRGLYQDLLERGVQIRRTIFLRPDRDPDAYRWIAEFGTHANLQQRVIAPPASDTMPFSFAIVDESVVLMAVPGFRVVDTKPFTERLIFRHLLAVRRPQIARAFLEMYEKLWEQAHPVLPHDLPALAAAQRSA